MDFLNTGPGVAGTLRRQVSTLGSVRRVSNVAVTDIVVHDGRAVGAVGMDVVSGDVVTFAAKAVILAAGGLTKIYRRNSASTNMGGEAYALALWAGADLIDMEFVQFFPIAHLAPRLVGMDPIMWDPFRYKLGGRLLNGNFDEFMHRYGGQDSGTYTTVRDQASYAILKEVEAGRGSPHGGVYLDFRHVPDATLRAPSARSSTGWRQNGIDLTQTPVEVAPTAHYHMGGHPRGRAHGDPRPRPLRRRRGRGRRQRRQPPVRQRHHRGAGVRRMRRPGGRDGRRRRQARVGMRRLRPNGAVARLRCAI